MLQKFVKFTPVNTNCGVYHQQCIEKNHSITNWFIAVGKKRFVTCGQSKNTSDKSIFQTFLLAKL